MSWKSNWTTRGLTDLTATIVVLAAVFGCEKRPDKTPTTRPTRTVPAQAAEVPHTPEVEREFPGLRSDAIA